MDLDNLFKTTSSSKDKKNNTIDLVVSDDLAFLQAQSTSSTQSKVSLHL